MEHAPTWLINSFIYLSAAVIAVPLSRALGLGSIIGYLAAGIAIGPWGLGLVTNVEDILHFAEFGDSFHHIGNIASKLPTESSANELWVECSVFNDIMEETGSDHGCAETHLSKFCSSCQRVDDVGFPGQSFLAGMGFVCKHIGTTNQRACRTVIVLHLCDKSLDCCRHTIMEHRGTVP